MWSAEKQNVKQTVSKIGQSWLNMHAVPLNKCKCTPIKSDSECKTTSWGVQK